MFKRHRIRQRRALAVVTALGVAAGLTTSGTALGHDREPDPDALPVEHAVGGGLVSLPVSKGPFPDTRNMQFLGQVAPDDMGAQPLPGVFTKGMQNDIWGWTSPAGQEYALVGTTAGLAVVRVTDPENPEFVGSLESQSPGDVGNIWGDPATFDSFAYFTSEIVGSELDVVDLSGLDDLGPAPSPDTVLPLPHATIGAGGYQSAHNIQVNEDTGFAYVAGVRLAPGAANNACGLDNPPRFSTLIYDLNTDPMDPEVAACLPNVGEHDFFPVVYDGPDERFQGSEIVFVFDGRDRTGELIGGFTEIWDATDKDNIEVLASARFPGLVFSHQGWTTEEQDFLFINDEIDELVLAGWEFSELFAQPVDNPTNKPTTGTFVVDIRELDNPTLVERFEHSTHSLDHNLVVKDDKIYAANYTSGTRVLQIERDADGMVSLSEFGHMDTEPRLPKNILNMNQQDRFDAAFLGQWGVFPLFDSGTIVASDINNGLIVMRLSDEPCQGMKCSK